MAKQDDDQNFPFEKPLSPVLSGSKAIRKILQSRKMQQKNRVKLTDRSGENSLKSLTSSTLSDASLTHSGNISSVEQVEIIEEERSVDSNKIQIKNPEFKTPEAPISFKRRKQSHRTECGGFKTAAGKNIALNLSDDALKLSKELFDDILNPNNSTLQQGRLNKYSFLSKRKSNSEYHEGAIKNDRDDIEISFLSTQETNELFSNFTISENISGNNVQDFQGFNLNTIKESENKAKEFKTHVSNFAKDVTTCTINKIVNLKTKSLPVLLKKRAVGTIVANSSSTSSKAISEEFDAALESRQFKDNIFVGFATASGKKMHINEIVLNNAKTKFLQEFSESELTSSDVFNIDSMKNVQKHDKVPGGFSTATGKKIQVNQKGLENAKIRFAQEFGESELASLEQKRFVNKASSRQCTGNTSVGFSTASGKKMQLNENLLESAKKKFAQEFDFDAPGFGKSKPLFSEQNKPYINKESNWQYAGSTSVGFSTASGKKMQLNENLLESAKMKFAQEFADEFVPSDFESSESASSEQNKLLDVNKRSSRQCTGSTSIGFSTASGKKMHLNENILESAKEKFAQEFTDQVVSSEPLAPIDINKERNYTEDEASTLVSEATLREFFADDTLTADDQSTLNSTKMSVDQNDSKCTRDSSNTSILQENISINNSNKSIRRNISSAQKKKRLGVSACKPIQISKDKMVRAAKLFEEESRMSPVRINSPSIYNSTPLKNSSLVQMDSEITPIKCINRKSSGNQGQESMSDRFAIRECTPGKIDMWSRNLEKEKQKLERQLKMIMERKEVLRLQKYFLGHAHQTQRRRCNGSLFVKKQSSGQVPLQYFLKVDDMLEKNLSITPQNAELVHFNYTQQTVSFVPTLDGARVIPNIDNFVGLSEIEAAFTVMDTVDPKLIPTGWIRNHFKWIVWKLASYENFASNMDDALSVENVIQQLKYRYDREIDKAQRSTLRKIFEMDDVPQKRMVLCVSNIFKLANGQFELELTDGWYCIKTVIDEALSKQVSQRKIRIGTKLMTCGADLLNCEGCHPLEAPDMIRLKISCNSTRRARWYAKLGYQKYPKPFPISLHSVFANGGVIGCIKIFVARVYPVKYMEKQNKLTVWRNRKAEEIRAQEWENKGRQDMENLRKTITRDNVLSIQNMGQNKNMNVSENELKSINCPETLYNLCQHSKDPENFQELLSNSQKESVIKYQQQLALMQQQEISRRMQESFVQRDVTPVLQFLVLDALYPNEKSSTFQIWRPSDSHLQIIKESSVLFVYNVLPKRNGDLSAMSRTKFEVVDEKVPDFSDFKRVVLPISQVSKLEKKPTFNQFDTVGIVVTLTVDKCSQSLWLADHCGSLLFIKIFETPKKCLLLDSLKKGQTVAVSNLIFCETKVEFGEAIANHLTIISSYPQSKYLQEAMTALVEHLPKDIPLFVEQCNQKISYYIDKVDITKDCRNVTSESLLQSKSFANSDIFDDGSDVLYTMINVEQFE